VNCWGKHNATVAIEPTCKTIRGYTSFRATTYRAVFLGESRGADQALGETAIKRIVLRHERATVWCMEITRPKTFLRRVSDLVISIFEVHTGATPASIVVLHLGTSFLTAHFDPRHIVTRSGESPASFPGTVAMVHGARSRVQQLIAFFCCWPSRRVLKSVEIPDHMDPPVVRCLPQTRSGNRSDNRYLTSATFWSLQMLPQDAVPKFAPRLCTSRKILDFPGSPTVEADVILEDVREGCVVHLSASTAA